MVTLQLLKDWRDIYAELCDIQWEKLPYLKVQWPYSNKRKSLLIDFGNTIPLKTIETKTIDYAVLTVVTGAIYWHPVRALIDGDAIQYFISFSPVQTLQLSTMKHHTFLELERHKNPSTNEM